MVTSVLHTCKNLYCTKNDVKLRGKYCYGELHSLLKSSKWSLKKVNEGNLLWTFHTRPHIRPDCQISSLISSRYINEGAAFQPKLRPHFHLRIWECLQSMKTFSRPKPFSRLPITCQIEYCNPQFLSIYKFAATLLSSRLPGPVD